MWHALADATASTGKVAMAAAAATGAIEAGAGAVDAARSPLASGVELDYEDSLLGGEACECYQAATTLPPPREGGPVAAQQLQQMATTMGLSRVTPESRIQNRSCGARRATEFEALSPEFFDVSVSNRVLGRIQNAKSAAGRILSCLKASTKS